MFGASSVVLEVGLEVQYHKLRRYRAEIVLRNLTTARHTMFGGLRSTELLSLLMSVGLGNRARIDRSSAKSSIVKANFEQQGPRYASSGSAVCKFGRRSLERQMAVLDSDWISV